MAKSVHIPKLCFHKSSQQFYAWHDGKRHHFGADKPEAEKRYKAFVAALVNAPPPPTRAVERPSAHPGPELTVAEAAVLYFRHIQAALKGGRKDRQVSRVKAAMLDLQTVCGEMPVRSFKGKAFELVQRHLVKRKIRRQTKSANPRFDANASISRQYANMLCREILTCFSWLVKEEIVPPDNLAIMREVSFIKEQDGVRESPRVTPVSPAVVEATLAGCHPILQSMIRLQQITGMRPGEICAMRRCDISTLPTERLSLPKSNYEVAAREIDGVAVWLYVPASHKTLWKRKPRVVLIGPKAQEILKPLLNREPTAHLFNPNEAVIIWRQLQREKRRSPVQPSQRDRRRQCPKLLPRQFYTNEAYGQALARTINRLNEERKEAGLPPIPSWAPNQLRHFVATEVAERFDEATAAALIGHCGLDTIKVYAEQAIGKAAKAAAEMG